jgi:uncharacterized repeat protein (TIGR02543 family)
LKKFTLRILAVAIVAFLILGLFFTPSERAATFFLDGFETGDTSAWGGTYLDSGCTFAASTTQKNTGTYSGKAYEPAFRICALAHIEVSAISTAYARCYVYYDDFPTTSSFQGCVILSGEGNDLTWLGVYNDAGTYKWKLVSINQGVSATLSTDNPVLHTWYCVELEWIKGASTAQVHFWLNGVSKLNQTGLSGNWNCDQLQVGLVASGRVSSSDMTVYVDDVIIADTGPIGPITGVQAHITPETTTVLINSANVTLTINPSGGTGTYAYQWYSAATGAITGATAQTIQITPGSVAGDYSFYAKVTSGGTTVQTDNTAVIHVVSALPLAVTATATSPTSIIPGGSVSFQATASNGTPPYSYQWKNRATGAIAGQTSYNPTIPFSTVGTYNIYVTVTDSASATADSTPDILVTVAAAVPIITLAPTGGSVGSTVTVTGTGFAASHVITIEYDGVTQVTVPSTVNSDGSGGFTCSFAVPVSSGCGARTVLASDGTNSASASFVVATDFSALPTNAPTYQYTPTYDGSNQSLHPDVAYFPSGWNGYFYWMVMTPYPWLNSYYENPSILASNDGVSWIVPTGLHNPIDSHGASDWFSDPSLLVLNNQLWCYYRSSDPPSGDRIYVKTSSNGVTWSERTQVLTGSINSLQSPAVEKVGSTYYMWVVDITPSPNKVVRRQSTDGLTWTNPIDITQIGSLPPGKEPWHLSVKYVSSASGYWMLLTDCDIGTNTVGAQMIFASSADGLSWVIKDGVFLDAGASGSWDESQIYRSTFLVSGNTLRIWYSAHNVAEAYHIGYTTASIARAYTLTVTTVGSGSVNLNSTGPYYYGDVVQLTAIPVAGWSFSGWSGALTGSANPTSLTVTGNMAVTAAFTQNTYTVSVTVLPSSAAGTVTPNTTGPYHYGDLVVLTESPGLGYTFSGWSGDGSGTGSTRSVTVTGNVAVTATFTQNTYPLIMYTVGQGSVVPGNQTFASGTVVDIKAINALGWNFAGWSGGASGSANTTVTMNGPVAVTATFIQNAYSLTVSTVGSGSVTKVPDQAVYAWGTNVTLTATPTTGWSFDHWSGDASGTVNLITVNITSDKTITAAFTQNTYALTATTSGSGSAVLNNTGPYHYGDTVQLTANPTVGWSFDHWSGDLSGSVNPTTILIDGNKAVTATFTRNVYTLTVTVVGSGSVNENNSGPHYYGDAVQLTAVPTVGWSFQSWSGGLAGSANPAVLILDSDKTVTATFTQNAYTLTISVSGQGSVSQSPDQATYTWGTNVTLNASAEIGWTFAGWSGDASGTTNPATVNMTGNMAVTATFTQNAYTLIVTTVGSGSVSRNNTESYRYGDVVELTAVPFTGWSFQSWSGDLLGSVNPSTIVINGNMAVTATFIQNAYSLTVSTVGSGSVVKVPDQASYRLGDVVQLTATSTAGWSFSVWSGDISGSVNPVSIIINGTTSVTATFSQNPYTPFSIFSNSTVTQLAFDSTSKVLEFTVSGPSGTYGFTNVTIAKTLISDISTLNITFDGKQMSYTVNDLTNYWSIYFTYHHSTHRVVMEFVSQQTKTLATHPNEVLLAVIGSAIFIPVMLAITIQRKRKSRNSTKRKN